MFYSEGHFSAIVIERHVHMWCTETCAYVVHGLDRYRETCAYVVHGLDHFSAIVIVRHVHMW